MSEQDFIKAEIQEVSKIIKLIPKQNVIEKMSFESRKKTLEKKLKSLHIEVLKKLTGSDWIAEYRFHDTRRWRFDFACLEKKVAIELEGVFNHSRHRTAKGFLGDMQKYNEAVKLGWRVLRYTPNLTKMMPSMWWENNIQEIIEVCKN